MPGPLACWKAPSEVQCGVSGKKLTEGSKFASCRHILTGLDACATFLPPACPKFAKLLKLNILSVYTTMI